MDAHRRQVFRGRGRLLRLLRPQRRHAEGERHVCLAGRGRGGADCAQGCARSGGGRGAGPGRSDQAQGVCRRQTRHPRRRRTRPGGRTPRPDHVGAVQMPALDRLPRRAAKNRDRQDPALQIARDGVTGATTGRTRMNLRTRAPSRRHVLAGAGAALLAAPPRIAIAETAKLKLGLMLPYTGTYAQLGDAITDGLKLAIAETSGRLGGREVEFSILDDESEPSKAPENANKLVNREKVDFLIGTVHSGVEMAMVKVARDTGTMLIIPNAGVGAATGALCAPNIFRTSFSNWQPAFPMGKVVADRGLKRAVTLTWQYAAGEESVGGFREGFTAAGGTILK